MNIIRHFNFTHPNVRRWLSSHGGALIEFTLILPFMLILAAGVWEYGRILETQLVVDNAAREGAHFASVNTTDPSLTVDTQNDVLAYLQTNLPNRYSLASSTSCTPASPYDVCVASSGITVGIYDSSGNSATAASGNQVQVKVQLNVTIFAPFVPGLQNPRTLYGQESMYLE